MKVPNAYRKQLQHAIDQGWLEIFQREARRIGETTAHLLAIGSRESGLQNIKGDFRNGVARGFGPLQVDVGTDPLFTARWSQSNAEPGIVRGAEIYAQKLEQVYDWQGKPVKFKDSKGRPYQFTGRAVEEGDARRIATAAYNCGAWASYAWANKRHIDSFTTGQDYGRDVYSLAIYFAQLLDEAKLEPGAFGREVAAQGKYALDEHQQQAGIIPTGDHPEALERFQLQIPDLSPQVASPPNVAAAQCAQTPEPPPPASSDSAPVQASATPEVRVFLQSLKTHVDEWLAYLGIPAAAVVTFFKSHPELIGVIVILALAAIWAAKHYGRYQLDRLVINTAADQNKNTVIPDKKAK